MKNLTIRYISNIYTKYIYSRRSKKYIYTVNTRLCYFYLVLRLVQNILIFYFAGKKNLI